MCFLCVHHWSLNACVYPLIIRRTCNMYPLCVPTLYIYICERMCTCVVAYKIHVININLCVCVCVGHPTVACNESFRWWGDSDCSDGSWQREDDGREGRTNRANLIKSHRRLPETVVGLRGRTDRPTDRPIARSNQYARLQT